MTTIFKRASILVSLLFLITSYSLQTDNRNINIEEQSHYDIIILNGRVLDGTGNPWVYRDIAIEGNRIVKVGDLKNSTADREINAEGLFVAPGFIDTHSHAASGLKDKKLSSAEPIIRQGITSLIINPDGVGSVNLKQQQEELMKCGLGLNVAQFIGHSSVREAVLGMEDRTPVDNELQEMKKLVTDGMNAGAFGLSSGLFSAPGSYAETEEVIELAKIVSEFNGVYASHIRDESNYNIGLIAAVEEAIKITEKAQLPGIITHIKALGPNVWGYSNAIVHRIETARSNGVEIFADQYPYTASATSLEAALLPQWALAGGREAFLKRLNSQKTRGEIKKEMNENLKRRGGADRIQFRTVENDEVLEGKTLADYAEISSLPPVEAALDLLKQGSPDIVSYNMQKSDLKTFMQQPWTMTVTDGDLVKAGEGVPHPRTYGAFSRKLGKYARSEGLITVPFAIRSMTYMVAQVFGFKDRGIIKEGAIADLLVFELEAIEDKAEYLDPHQLSTGMIHVLVNGEPVLLNGELIENLPGKILKKNQ